MLPSLDSLRCFAAAARFLNFRAAARSVALTPAALGQRIRQLEEQLDAALFLRTTRSVSLTEAGLALLPFAERCLAAAGDCVRAARGDTGPPPMEIVLGTRQELGMSWVVPQLDRLSQIYPSLDLHLYFGSGPDLLLRVRTMEIDCAVTSSRFSDPRLAALPLHQEDFIFVASPELLRRTPFTRHEHAADHTLVDAGPDLPLFRSWRDAPGGGHLPFGRVLRYGSLAAILHLVLEGRGVAVLPRYFVAPLLARRRVRHLFPRVHPLPDTFRLVYRADDDARLSTYRTLAEWFAKQPLV